MKLSGSFQMFSNPLSPKADFEDQTFELPFQGFLVYPILNFQVQLKVLELTTGNEF